jgi:hypothetical protein
VDRLSKKNFRLSDFAILLVDAFDPHTRTGSDTAAQNEGPRSFQFDLEMNINIYCMHYIIREDSQEVFNFGPLFRV